MATEETTPPVTEESKEDVKSKDTSVEDAKLAIDMLAQGKRNVICGEIPVAVNQFQEACALLAKQYGETAKECAEAYFCYGQSLLDLARMETGVLGNALQGVDVEEESEEKEGTSEQFEKADLKDDERDKLRQEVVEAMSEQDAKGQKADKEGTNGESGMEVENTDEKGDKENSEKKGEGESSSSKDKEGEGEEGEEEEEGDEAEEAEDDDGGEGTSDAKQDDEDADDVSNLQLAWEMLELSKMIYLKDPSKETQLKAAQAYLKLGEVSLETEQYEQATDDFKACLEIQKEHLEVADRLLAETHYQLGLACSFDKKFDMSIEHYKAAIKVIEDKIGLLEKVIEEKSSGKGKELSSTDDPVSQATQEIKELKEILPDISSKIEDAEEEKKNLEQLKNMTKEIVGETLTTFSSSTESAKTAQTIEVKKASDISHLIRRKRKPDDDADAEDQESKKSRQEDGSGDAPVVTQNGHDKKPEEAKKDGKASAEAEPMAT